MQKIKYIALVLSIVLFTQCELDHDDFQASDADVDFSHFVALGDSYTAGYTDGALGRSGQENGFSYILAKQLEYVGSEGYIQPLVQSESSIGSAGNSYYQLKAANSSLSPVPGVGDQAIFAERVYDAGYPVQNLGVPGAKSFHLLATAVSADPLMYYSQANPFFGRFASSTETSIIADAVAQKPTFISLWIGNNDVLTYALAGGETDAVTPADEYAQYLSVIASTLFANGTKGVIANIPDIETIPYINYILSSGFLPLVIEDDQVPGGIRQLVEGEKVLLPASTLLQSGYGQSVELPLPAEYVLDLEEMQNIKTATIAYNQTIANIATQYNLALVDLNAVMNKAHTQGYIIDGNVYNSTFVSGGVFSLDGIHATGRGSAIIANEFIKAINHTYNCSIPYATVNEYSSVVYP